MPKDWTDKLLELSIQRGESKGWATCPGATIPEQLFGFVDFLMAQYDTGTATSGETDGWQLELSDGSMIYWLPTGRRRAMDV